ncbi:MAG: TadE/TadG family type IV pilus assembly protein, partial [Streptosporangiaceae bacterium]
RLSWWRGERGALTLFVAILFPVLLAFAGLVLDAGTKLDNYENAATYAQEAARAGAGQVNQSEAYSSATFVVDQAGALMAANAYLGALPPGVSGTVTPVGTNSIEVTVTITTPTKILSIIGIDTVTSRATATASLLSGVTGPGS